MTKEELLAFVKASPEATVDLILKLSQPAVPTRPVTSHDSVEDIISGTIGTVHTGLEKETLPDIGNKLSGNLDDLIKKLRQVK